MELIDKLPKIEIHSVGEFRMGAMGYGLTIRTSYGTYDFLKDVPVLIGSTHYETVVDISNDERYFKILSPDVTYILDSKHMKASIYRIAVRAAIEGDDGRSESIVYSEENCVFGQETQHINGFREHIYLQCPWVGQDQILSLVGKYQALRENQLKAAIHAV
ncbi:hypothetical protein [Gynuella sp.]|uniref:hypothetical protein n=1 Tax=Gynuella sp. TaxID=2969146 RepID=UPI003D0BAE98